VSILVNVSAGRVTRPFDVDFDPPKDFQDPPILTCALNFDFRGSPLIRSLIGWFTETAIWRAESKVREAFTVFDVRTLTGLPDAGV
jgi:hypothetical protein